MKKICVILMTVLLSSTFADICTVCECDKPCECPCPEFTPCPPPTSCAINAPYGIDLVCQWDLFTTASFLWWEIKEDNVSLGCSVEQNIPASPTESQFYGNTVHAMDFTYKPGFKVGLGINFDCDNWQIYAEYTYHHSSQDTKIATVPSSTLPTIANFISPYWLYFPIITHDSQSTNVGIISAAGNLKVHLDLIDIELSRQYYVGRCLTFQTIVGLRSSFIKQIFSASYNSEVEDDNNPGLFLSNNQIKSWGIGPRIGLNTNWHFCEGFRIFVDSSASILYTKYTKNNYCHQLITYAQDPEDPPFVLADGNFSKELCGLRSYLDITLGLGWGDYFFCNKWYFDIEIGYAFSLFKDQNMFLSYINTQLDPATNVGEQYFTVRGGDLYAHGLIVTAKIEF